ncbi:MAG: transposase, partial [Rhodococcus sp.]|nr:transposase [Rhodococcus sp. (in: high G+C Gram-positive bacteria)]
LEQHRRWMQTERAEAVLRRRPGLIESVFGIIKERQAGHRFLLRSIEAVEAEWSLLATAFNLRALSKHSRRLLEMLASGPPRPATES